MSGSVSSNRSSTEKALEKLRRYPCEGRVDVISEKVATELKGLVRGDVILPNDGRYVRAKYDSENVFRHTQNISPT
ncbi:MAG: hypothetical protein E6K09_06995 [Methanobacteriota archaeon]|nr:MAG: hypothetical protein E6K09_06995 [Euryarchaeota archaeon]